MIIHDLRCLSCGTVEPDVPCESGRYPSCVCGGARTWVPTRFNTDITGGPIYMRSLDREFDSKSSLRSYLKENGLQEAGDKVGGARNESHLNLGKGFSYKGMSRRATAAESAGRKPRAG